jgi:hypothetical protein
MHTGPQPSPNRVGIAEGCSMSGALNLTEPHHLLAKLSHEIDLLAAEPRNSYRAGWKETQAIQIGNETGKAFKAEGAFRIQFIDAEPAPLQITHSLPKAVV